MDMGFTTPPATVARVLEMQARIFVVLAWWFCLVVAGVLATKYIGPLWGAGIGYYAALAVMSDYASPDNVGVFAER